MQWIEWQWLPFKVASDLLSAGNILVGKEMLSGRVTDRRLYIVCVALVSLPLAAWGAMAGRAEGPALVTGACAVGVLYIASGDFYYRALAAQHPVQTSLIQRLSPAFTLLGTTLLLHERLTTVHAAGFVIAMVGGLIPMIAGGGVRLTQGAVHALLSTLLGVASTVLTAALLHGVDAWTVFTVSRLGVLLGTLLLLGPRGTGATLGGVAMQPRRYAVLLFGEQVVRLGALWLQTQALAASGSPITIAVLSGFVPAYVWALARIARRAYTGDVGLIRQGLAGMLLLAGTLLLLL